MEASSRGLSSQEAKRRLCTVIQEEVKSYEEELRRNRTMSSMFGQRSCFGSTVLFSPISALFLLLCGIALLASAMVIPDVYILVEAFFLILFCGLNCCLSQWDMHVKRKELVDHSRGLLKHLEDAMLSSGDWNARDYLPLHIPESSSISVQWTYRDGELLNLPQALLVEGDLILMRPGRTAPGRARKLTDESAILRCGQVFLPEVEAIPLDAAIKTPLRPEEFLMLETPYRRYLKECLQQGNHRPVTLLENRRLMGCHFIERAIIPVVLILSLIVNVIRNLALEGDTGHWAEMLIVLQVNVILPLCPMAFPIMWILLNHYGNGRLVALFHLSRLQTDQHGEKFEFSEEDNILDQQTPRVTWGEILRHAWSSFIGTSSHLPRTANLLHGLGTVTSFSCVDKEGILSYPDPTMEKIFFMSSSQDHSDEQYNSTNSVISVDSQLGRPPDWTVDQEDSFLQTHAEVLTISANPESFTGLQFDEPDWEKHLSSLKPMGLNILLNACRPEIVPNYHQFLDHVHAVTAYRLDQQPLCPQRRCLCQAAYLMGFTEEASKQYSVEQQIAMYKALPTGRRPEASFRSRSLVQRKNLVPHGLSTIVKDFHSGDYQVLTQGSANLVLSLCTDFWDGWDLHTLTDSDRKKILDFYSRAKLTSYCSVLSYQPVVDYLPERQDNMYIELPPTHSKHGYRQLASPDIARSSWEVNVPFSSIVPELPKARKCRSLDSAIDSVGTLPVGEECLRLMSGQIFIGMVTLNFHPKSDIVTLIEQLDQACIRFVHFSEDQVLRSKVFAEKMGLEAGWNCHISLKSETHSSTPGSYSQGSLAGIEQLELDIEAQRVRFKEDSTGNVHEETEVIERSNEVAESSDEVLDEERETEQLLQGSGSGEDESVEPRTERAERKNESSHSEEEQQPLIDHNIRQRQISETHTCSDGTDVETTDSVTAGVDLSNRARLPRGIEMMRPHIKNIDNVPLQVPLFTDVTPETTKEMIEIMQENNEVVCVLGSSVRLSNMALFAQADFSIGLEPLYPHICLQGDESREDVKSLNQDNLHPMELTAKLTSLPCSVYFHRNDNISITAIVQEARILCQGITNCFSFFLFAILTISAISFISSLFLPPPLSGRHILWLAVFVAPWLSLSLVGTPGGSEVMRWATGKNTYKMNRKNIFMLFGCFLAKFGGMIPVTLSCHVLTLNSLCVQQNLTSTCHLTYGNRDYTNPWNGLMEEVGSHLALSQNLNMFFITLYLVVISSSFVHPLMLLWRHTPLTNGVWCIVSFIILVLSVILLVLVTPLFLDSRQPPVQLSNIPLAVWLLGFVWPLPNLMICEAVKVLEIREYVRWQKRSKLLFDTKLGMNSPF